MKLMKKVASIMAVIAIAFSVIVVNKNLNAATGIGYSKGTTAIINNRGDNAEVTYEFSVDPDNGPIAVVYAKFTWDPALMTLDLSGSTADNMSFHNYDETIGKIDAQIINTMRDDKCGVTLKFTNVLPSGTTATSSPINVEFKAAAAGTVEFAGDDLVTLYDNQIVYTDGGVTLNLPVSVAITPASASVVKGDSETFSATVTNDNGSGVTWSVSGNTSSSTTIDASGNLTIGSDETASSVVVKATSLKDSSKSATANVTVLSKPSLSLSLTPTSKKVFKGETSSVQFSATPTTSSILPTTIVYTLSGANDAGTTINASTGELTISANETANELTVKAEATNTGTEPTTVSQSAKVSLVEIGVIVNPSSAVVEKGATQDFVATVSNDLNNDGVTWNLVGATSSATTLVNGKLVVGADETATTLTVEAISVKDSSKKAQATVSVVEAKEIAISIDPETAEVQQGKSKKFTATIENDKANAGVEWEVLGATSSATTITPQANLSATLKVGEDEAVGSILIVVATSVSDEEKLAVSLVLVTEKDEVELPTKPTNPTKPGSEATTPNEGGNSGVTTGDVTNKTALTLIALSSLLVIAGIVTLKRKRETE